MFSPSRNLKSKVCAICAKRFETSHANALCCSDRCKRTRRNELQNQKNELFGRKEYYVKKQPEKRVCVMCGDIFHTAHYSKRTCSKDCARLLQNKSANAIQRKEKNPNGVRGGDTKKRSINPAFLVRGTISVGSCANGIGC